MSKDPAVLFYTSDFLTGTAFFTDEQCGQYIRLLCHQHQSGHIPESFIMNILHSAENPVWSKFVKDERGFYFNERMENEKNKRLKHSEHQRSNAIKRWSGNAVAYPVAYPVACAAAMPLGNENGNENDTGIEVSSSLQLKEVDSIGARMRAFQFEIDKFEDISIKNRQDFFVYWSEPTQNGLKMRCELQKTWDLKRRLNTWVERSQERNGFRTGSSRRDFRTGNGNAGLPVGGAVARQGEFNEGVVTLEGVRNS